MAPFTSVDDSYTNSSNATLKRSKSSSVMTACKFLSISLIVSGPSIQELIKFSHALEEVCVETVQSGKMTKDLAVCVHGNKVTHGKDYLYTEEFLDALNEGLKKKLG